jgi:predicted enzyme related to lactoylglutathione lyase
VKESGADITQDVVSQPYGRDFALRDPFGNHIRIGEIY